MRGNVIHAYSNSDRTTYAGILYQYDYGQRIVFHDLELPNAYEVHFSNEERGISKTVIGDETGADIPDEFLLTGKNVHVWMYLHTGDADGETEYHWIINVTKRAKPVNEEPTPVQQDVITQTIAALNEALEQSETNVTHYPQVIENTWFVWDAETQTFVSTGVDARGLPGQDGTGIQSITLNADYTLTFVYTDGTSYTTGSIRGEKGDRGDPGISPTATIEKVGKVATVTITDINGTTTAEILDGKGSEPSDFIDDTAGAGVLDKAWSADKNTDELNLKADKTDTILYTSLSRGRKAETSAGNGSVAFGNNVTASGTLSRAIGSDTVASGTNSSAEGYKSTASGSESHAEGTNAIAAAARSHAEGYNTRATNTQAHAEGDGTTASGSASHAEGNASSASGSYAHAEGSGTVASGNSSHAEGGSSVASGGESHAEGDKSKAIGDYSHAEGELTKAEGYASHAEGSNTKATNAYGHAEGSRTTASGLNSHAEGSNTRASGIADHAEGGNTQATGNYSHAEGYESDATAYASHAEGGYNEASGMYSHAEGEQTKATNSYAHAEGNWTVASGMYSHAEGYAANASASASHSEGNNTAASGMYSHAEGNRTRAMGDQSHAEGERSINADTRTINSVIYHYGAYGNSSHAEGKDTIAGGYSSHAEGSGTAAITYSAHAEGSGTIASGAYSHAEGGGTTAGGAQAHAEGGGTQATGTNSHAEGGGTQATGDQAHSEGATTRAVGYNSHAEGVSTWALGYHSHTEGVETIANGNISHVTGKCNVADTYGADWPEWTANTQYAVGDKVKITSASIYEPTIGYICNTANSDSTFDSSKWDRDYDVMTYAEIVGNGASANNRSNAYALGWDGTGHFAGDVYVGCNPDSTGGTKLVSMADIPNLPTIYRFSYNVQAHPGTLNLDTQQQFNTVWSGSPNFTDGARVIGYDCSDSSHWRNIAYTISQNQVTVTVTVMPGATAGTLTLYVAETETKGA